MSNSFSFDVFLSHSSKDKDVVRPLAERLRKDGLRVWFDQWEIHPGDNIPKKLEDGLVNSRVLVLCMSANAFGSDWAQMESGTLRFRDPLNKDRRFLPLRLDETPIRGSLAQFLYVNWLPAPHEQEYPKVLAACRPPLRQPAPESEFLPKQTAQKIIPLDTKVNILCFVFSPDRKRALIGASGAVHLWDFGTGHCLRLLEGHKGAVWHLAWSPDSRGALSAGDDGTVRLWDIDSRRCVGVLKGHTEGVLGVAWSPDSSRALSGSRDQTVRLWDLQTLRCVGILKGHADTVLRVAWSPDSSRALSGGRDNAVRLWDIDAGRCLSVLEGHTSAVLCVAWSPDSRRALSSSTDSTVRLWDLDLGRCLRVLEGHGRPVDSVVWSPDSRFALSGSDDRTVRVWDLETGRCLRVLEGHTNTISDVAWSSDSRFALSGSDDNTVRVWDLSEFLTKSRPLEAPVAPLSPMQAPEQVQYTNAKVLLVGDTGVGKSGLAERLVYDRFVPTKSTHARQAYVLDTNVLKRPDGVSLNQETLLWDLAGQPAYRSVHQLSMDDAALACVLFDARSETNPFEGAAYWSQVLDQSRTNTKLKKFLVASRIDVGGLPESKDRMESFARENGFEPFLATSAFTGEGCKELREAIRNSIPWEELPKVTTTKALDALRRYVEKLKQQKTLSETADNNDGPSISLLTISALHEGFVADFGEKVPFDEFVAQLQRLEASDTVDLLAFQTTGAAMRPEDLVLLDPTRVDAYSSALLVAAKDEPDGPGHLLESRVRDGKFTLDKDQRLADPATERHVLWYVVEKLLSRDLALRERIKGQDYLVFPSQCTAELRFPGAAAFGVTFGFAGPVRTIYARLIAHLAHYEGFKKREFFRDAAAYHADPSGRCIIRLRDLGRGQGELEVFYDNETPGAVRQGFLEFVSKQLEANGTAGSVTRRHAYHCANPKCANPFEDRVVKARLEAKKRNLICPICEEKTPLIDLFAAASIAAESMAAQITIDAKTGRQRMTAAFVIKAKETEGKFDIFLSHNSKDKAAVEKIAKQLKAVGLRPWFDKWDLAPGSIVQDALERAIRTIPCAALCFGPADTGAWHILEIRAYVEAWAKKNARMIPIILPGVEKTPDLPLFVRQTLWVDLRDWESEKSDAFYQLVCGVLGRAPGESPMRRFGPRDVAEWQGMRF